ncbi:tetratricopeptide repeat protein [Chitinophaga lutea]
MQENDHTLVARYLTGEMPPEARKAFEERMLAEPRLREALESAAGRYVPHLRRSGRQMVQRVFIAAVTLAVVVALLLYISPWKHDVSKQFTVPEMSYLARGTPADSSLAQAVRSFNRRHYPQAIASLTAVLNHDPGDTYARYFRGLAYLENKEITRSRADLHTVYDGGSTLAPESAFYIALGYLKEHNRDKCLEWLTRVSKNAENYKRAQQLQQSLRSK